MNPRRRRLARHRRKERARRTYSWGSIELRIDGVLFNGVPFAPIVAIAYRERTP